MDNSAPPRLTNNVTGTVIEVNANPFSLGRGLACNYVIPNKTISRVHCTLAKIDNLWVVKDSSTNGTFVNGKLVKQAKSGPLKDNDTICLEGEGAEQYIFNIDQFSSDISDEQLCAIADSVLNEVEILSANPIPPDSGQSSASTLPISINLSASAVIPLQDHMYMAKSSNNVKRAKVGPSIVGSSSGGGTSHSSRDTIEIVDSPMPTQQSPQKSVPGTSQGRRYYTRRAAAANACLDNTIISVLDNSAAEEMQVSTEDIQVQPGPSTSNTEELPLPPPPPKEPEQSLKTEPVDKNQQSDNFEVMENELQCVICSELFIKAVTLNCSHSFCKYCIGLWNKNKSDCPICRTKITAITATIVLDNLIEKVVEKSSEEIKVHRGSVLEERKKQEAETVAPPPPRAERTRRRNRGRANNGRGGARNNRSTRTVRVTTARPVATATGAQPDTPRINVLDPLSINIGALINNVIEVSSDSDWSSDTESMSSMDMREDYDNDDWYDRPYYGGYGHCFRCGSPNHWANSCPNR